MATKAASKPAGKSGSKAGNKVATPVVRDSVAVRGLLPTMGRRRGRRTQDRVLTVCVLVVLVLAIALGTYLRLWMLGNLGITSDEAVVGLAAHQILHGHFTTFYWGQSYGGVEPYAVALLFLVFGTHAWVINATAALLFAVAIVLVWRLGSRATGNGVLGAFAAAIVWVWPYSEMWNSTREYGFRGVVLVCGLGALLCTLRILQREDGRSTWFVLGATTGLGFWASPEIVFFLLPVLGGLLFALRGRLRGGDARAFAFSWVGDGRREKQVGRSSAADVATAAAAALLFGLPWIYTNLRTGFSSLGAITSGEAPGNTYVHRLHIFFSDVLPMSLGARVPASGAWVDGRAFGIAILVVVLSAAVLGIVFAGVRIESCRLLVGYVVAFPFISASMVPTDYWFDGRYGTLLTPVLVPLVVAGLDVLVRELGRRRPLFYEDTNRPWTRSVVAGAACVALGVLTVHTVVASSALGSDPSVLSPDPNQVGTRIVSALDEHGVHDAYANYWVAYDLDMTGGMAGGTGRPGRQVLVSPVDSVRNLDLARQVAAARSDGWLFVGPTTADRDADVSQFTNPSMEPFGLTANEFIALLTEHGLRYRVFPAATMTAVVPSGDVPPRSILNDLR